MNGQLDRIAAPANEPLRGARRRASPPLRGTIVPCDAAVAEAAFRRFVHGMAALATELLLTGALDGEVRSQPSINLATYDDGSLAA